eukprot:2811264-Prymnesium_polylepis.1
MGDAGVIADIIVFHPYDSGHCASHAQSRTATPPPAPASAVARTPIHRESLCATWRWPARRGL